jgi:hypothetical protein
MKRSPVTKVRSEWEEFAVDRLAGMEPDLRAFRRNVSDGHLTVLVGTIAGQGCHLSISHRTNHQPPRPGRYPRWDEIADARERFCPPDVTMAMLLPPASEYVAIHDTTFHLHALGKEAAA